MKMFFTHFILTIIASVAIHEHAGMELSGIAEFFIYAGIMVLLWLSSFVYHRVYFRQFFYSVWLFVYFSKELFISNLEIIYYVVTPGLQFKPALLKLPLDVKSDAEIVLLANLITLTPGSLTIEISPDKKFLFFHTINVPKDDVEAAKRKVKDGFEKRIMAITQ